MLAQRLEKVQAKHAAEVVMAEKKLAAATAQLNNQLAALDDEEAELMRRLASGELSPEEEAEVRARLAAIVEERQTIQSRIEQQGFAAQHALIDSALSALADEEAELLRRLASGELTPEEEAAVHARLAAIAKEREGLLEQRADVSKAEEKVLRELAARGVLSPDEQARVQARLEQLEAEVRIQFRPRIRLVAAVCRWHFVLMFWSMASVTAGGRYLGGESRC